MKALLNYRIKNFLVFLIPLAFVYFGGDCNSTNTPLPVIPDELVGKWVLGEQTGAQQDICASEVVDFQVIGVAVLTCPNNTSISRNYQVVDSILTYTQTNISYVLKFISNQKILLKGQNVSRNLYYDKIPTDIIKPAEKTDNPNSINSSEGGN